MCRGSTTIQLNQESAALSKYSNRETYQEHVHTTCCPIVSSSLAKLSYCVSKDHVPIILLFYYYYYCCCRRSRAYSSLVYNSVTSFLVLLRCDSQIKGIIARHVERRTKIDFTVFTKSVGRRRRKKRGN